MRRCIQLVVKHPSQRRCRAPRQAAIHSAQNTIHGATAERCQVSGGPTHHWAVQHPPQHAPRAWPPQAHRLHILPARLVCQGPRRHARHPQRPGRQQRHRCSQVYPLCAHVGVPSAWPRTRRHARRHGHPRGHAHRRGTISFATHCTLFVYTFSYTGAHPHGRPVCGGPRRQQHQQLRQRSAHRRHRTAHQGRRSLARLVRCTSTHSTHSTTVPSM